MTTRSHTRLVRISNTADIVILFGVCAWGTRHVHQYGRWVVFGVVGIVVLLLFAIDRILRKIARPMCRQCGAPMGWQLLKGWGVKYTCTACAFVESHLPGN